jgi:hypothetical protein
MVKANIVDKDEKQLKFELVIANTTISDNYEVAKHFNSYFTSVVDEIRADIPQIPCNFPVENGGDDILIDTTDNKVLNIINGLKNMTSTGIDGIPTAIMKTCIRRLHLCLRKSLISPCKKVSIPIP